MRRLLRNLPVLFLAVCGLALPARAAMDDYKFVKLQALDKSTARSETFVAEVGSTIQYGPLFIKIQSCRKSQPIDKPESVSFLQIWEVPAGAEKSTWVFSGWMFASSPALSAMDHPIYDVWVLDCQNDKNEKTDKPAPAPSVSEPKAQNDLKAAETPAEEPSAPAAEEIPVDSEAAPDAADTPPAPETTAPEPELPPSPAAASEPSPAPAETPAAPETAPVDAAPAVLPPSAPAQE